MALVWEVGTGFCSPSGRSRGQPEARCGPDVRSQSDSPGAAGWPAGGMQLAFVGPRREAG